MNIHTQVYIQICFISHGFVPRSGVVELYDKFMLTAYETYDVTENDRAGHPKISFSNEITTNCQI